MTGRRDTWWGRLLFKEKPPEVMPSGLVRWERMDERFRERCAVWSDGRVLIADGYANDVELRALLVELQRTGAVRGQFREETASLQEVAEVWRGNRVRDESLDVNPRIVEGLVAIFTEAARARASDVVLEKGPDDCRVFAIVNDRKLPLGSAMTVREAEQVFGFLFFVKDEGSRQTSLQRASFQGFSVRRSETFPLPEEIAALRCEAGPHEPEGHHLYMRLFYRDQVGGRKTLEDLGFTAEVAGLFREIRMSKYGGIFIGGTTGDGKSTTLAVNLNLQMREHGHRLNMVTLEDPVEYDIPGAVQIAVGTRGIGEERGLGFAAALMHFVRVHPASGMVGEIRDKMGAQQVLQFIDSGHQVWTTIHVHTANGILFRLMDLGVEVSEVTKPGNIRLLVKQTLVPLLCPECARPALPEGRDLPEELAVLLGPGVRYRSPEGCPQCRTAGQSALSLAAWAGYVRPLAVAEWIVPDDGYLRFVQKRDAVGAWNHWVDAMGGVPIGRKIWRAVGEGRVDPADAMLKGAEIAEAKAVFGPSGEGLREDGPGHAGAAPGKPVLVVDAEAVE